MKKLAWLAILVVVMCSALLASAPGARADGPPSPVTAALGKSLQDYMRMYFTWSLGGPQTDHHGNVAFLPIPSGTYDTDTGYYVGSTEVGLKSDWSFFLPVYIFYGEKYDDGSEDAPAWPAETDLTSAEVVIALDGVPIIQSSVDDLSDYYADTVYFRQPITYPEPTSYNSVAAIWVKGIGFVEPPLSAGEHTLHLLVKSQFLHDNWGFWGWDNSWIIDVGE